ARDLLASQKQWLEEEVERRVSENAQLETRLQLALESSGFGIWEFEHATGRLEWSASLGNMFGLESAPETLAAFLTRVHPEDLARAAQSFDRLQIERGIVLTEYRVRHQDGRWLWIEGRGRGVRYAPDGRVELSLGTLSDISARKVAEAERLLTGMVFQRIRDGICITDAQSNILLVNEAFTQVTGYENSEVVGRTPKILKSGIHSTAFFQDIWSKIKLYGNWQGEITNRRKDGALYSEWVNISALKNPEGGVTHFVAIYSDLSERREAAERIQYLSSYDSLTGLPNRGLFADRLEQSLMSARRFERGTAVILLDLDRFRAINDTLGPPVGDEVLIEVARRLSLQVREGDTVGRRSSNEFGFVMGSLGHERDAISLAQRMLEAISVPVVVNGQSVTITASIGISVAPKNGDSSEILLKCADIALLRAKEGGRNTFRFYSPEMDADAARRLGLEVAMRDALEHQEMSVYYQPQISLDSGQMLGMEALLRWHNPDFGQVSPLEFIPIAEESGLIVPIGEWVLRTASLQTKVWRDLGLLPLRVAVNLSTRQFRQPNLITMIGEVLAETGLPASALELEITESAFIDDV
ncbi:MAG: diguanylate cyclase, partial [Betaproteobacteria bacterium]|nr:diguanylate cyclase [Betaproteobacteria bacterium]